MELLTGIEGMLFSSAPVLNAADCDYRTDRSII